MKSICSLQKKRWMGLVVYSSVLVSAGTAWAADPPPGFIFATGSGKVSHGASGDVRTDGQNVYGLTAEAYDSETGTDEDHRSGLYRPAPASYPAITAEREGTNLKAESKAEMNTFTRWFGADGWDSGRSLAKVTKKTLAAGGWREGATALSIVLDPNSYEVGLTENSSRFFMTFGEGMNITAIADSSLTGASASASISGSMNTTHPRDLTTSDPLGQLFTYQWSTTANSPSGSQFLFSSNPALGLDDTAIMNAFMNAVQYDPATGYTLQTDIMIVSQQIPATPGSVYDVGGNTDYAAAAAVVPSSAVASLLGMGGVFAASRRRRG